MRATFGRGAVAAVAAMAVVALVLVGCATEDVEDTSAGATVSAECNKAFEDAAAVGEMEDTVQDLDPALQACTSIDEWIAAAESNPGAIDGDPVQFLLNRCLDTEVAAGAICDEVTELYPDGLYVTPYATPTAGED